MKRYRTLAAGRPAHRDRRALPVRGSFERHREIGRWRSSTAPALALLDAGGVAQPPAPSPGPSADTARSVATGAGKPSTPRIHARGIVAATGQKIVPNATSADADEGGNRGDPGRIEDVPAASQQAFDVPVEVGERRAGAVVERPHEPGGVVERAAHR